MSTKPLVSVVIPTYNQEKYIANAIQSVLQQDYQNIEVIVSDDNSTDNTNNIIDMIAGKESKVKHIRNNKNYGRVKNYRRSFYNYVKGDYALNLDGDDYLVDRGYISKAVKLFQENEDLVLVFSNIKTYIEYNGNYIENKMNQGLPKIIDGNWLFINFFKNYSIPHLTSVHRVNDAKEIGFYRYDINGADWESQLRLMLNKKIGYINEYSGVWRKHKNNFSANLNVDDILRNTKFIDGPYEYAKSKSIFTSRELDSWRKKMLKRMFFNGFLKLIFLQPSQKKTLLEGIKRYDEKIYRSFVYNLNYMFLNVVGSNELLMTWVFKKIIKQESFIEDLKIRKKIYN